MRCHARNIRYKMWHTILILFFCHVVLADRTIVSETGQKQDSNVTAVYKDLTDHLQKITQLQSVNSLLQWDQQVVVY
jgi:hypothetical protein